MARVYTAQEELAVLRRRLAQVEDKCLLALTARELTEAADLEKEADEVRSRIEGLEAALVFADGRRALFQASEVYQVTWGAERTHRSTAPQPTKTLSVITDAALRGDDVMPLDLAPIAPKIGIWSNANIERRVTGVMVATADFFFGILEGPKETVFTVVDELKAETAFFTNFDVLCGQFLSARTATSFGMKLTCVPEGQFAAVIEELYRTQRNATVFCPTAVVDAVRAGAHPMATSAMAVPMAEPGRLEDSPATKRKKLVSGAYDIDDRPRRAPQDAAQNDADGSNDNDAQRPIILDGRDEEQAKRREREIQDLTERDTLRAETQVAVTSTMIPQTEQAASGVSGDDTIETRVENQSDLIAGRSVLPATTERKVEAAKALAKQLEGRGGGSGTVSKRLLGGVPSGIGPTEGVDPRVQSGPKEIFEKRSWSDVIDEEREKERIAAEAAAEIAARNQTAAKPTKATSSDYQKRLRQQPNNTSLSGKIGMDVDSIDDFSSASQAKTALSAQIAGANAVAARTEHHAAMSAYHEHTPRSAAGTDDVGGKDGATGALPSFAAHRSPPPSAPAQSKFVASIRGAAASAVSTSLARSGDAHLMMSHSQKHNRSALSSHDEQPRPETVQYAAPDAAVLACSLDFLAGQYHRPAVYEAAAAAFSKIVREFGGNVVEKFGDIAVATFNVVPRGPTTAVSCGLRLKEEITDCVLAIHVGSCTIFNHPTVTASGPALRDVKKLVLFAEEQRRPFLISEYAAKKVNQAYERVEFFSLDLHQYATPVALGGMTRLEAIPPMTLIGEYNPGPEPEFESNPILAAEAAALEAETAKLEAQKHTPQTLMESRKAGAVVTGLYTRPMLEKLFRAMDPGNCGWVGKRAFKDAIAGDTFVTFPDFLQDQARVDSWLSRCNSLGDTRLSFDEFCMLCFKLQAV